jgi:hypothetical protein
VIHFSPPARCLARQAPMRHPGEQNVGGRPVARGVNGRLQCGQTCTAARSNSVSVSCFVFSLRKRNDAPALLGFLPGRRPLLRVGEFAPEQNAVGFAAVAPALVSAG